MKKIISIVSFVFICFQIHAQDTYTSQMQAAVSKLDNTSTISDYQRLENTFLQLATNVKKQWLAYYYAAFCNAKIGWLKQDADPDNIEQFATKALDEIKTAQSLIDTVTQKNELSEIYCIYSMANRAFVFISPMSNGRKYGPQAAKYIMLAEQLNPDNPRALYLEGWQKITTPKLWGGDKTKGKELLTQAKAKLYTQSTSEIKPHWGSKEVEDLLRKTK